MRDRCAVITWSVLIALLLILPGFAARPEQQPRGVLRDVAALDHPVTYTETKRGDVTSYRDEPMGVAAQATHPQPADATRHPVSRLIEARIAAGMSQRELARVLGIKEQQVQRYEATEYASASLARVIKVAHALAVEVGAR
jgi:ribosome-binding protein aMBF1 (putative translation factor)